MTKAQIQRIENLLGYESGYDVLSACHYFVISDDDLLYTDQTRYRYKFDDTNELLEKIQVRLYSTDITNLPSHSNYDVISVGDKTYVYEYLMDSKSPEHVMTDYFSYKEIIAVVPRSGFVTMDAVDAEEV